MRSESLKPATLVYFDIATDFLVRLTGTTSWNSGENYDWLKKYEILKKYAPPEETRPRIAEGVRAGLSFDIAGIRTALATYLKDRIDAMENQLVFVEECLPRDLQAETPLKVIQFWHHHPMPPNASLANAGDPLNSPKQVVVRKFVNRIDGLNHSKIITNPCSPFANNVLRFAPNLHGASNIRE